MPIWLITAGQVLKPLLQRFWREILILVLIGFIWYQNTSDTRYLLFVDTIPNLEKQLVIANNNVETCKKGNENLSQTIEDRNDEVLQWKKVSDELEEQNKALSKELKNMRKSTNTQVKHILEDKAPKSCEGAMNYLRSGRQDLTW